MSTGTQRAPFQSAFMGARRTGAAFGGMLRRHPIRAALAVLVLAVIAGGIWVAAAGLPKWKVLDRFRQRDGRSAAAGELAQQGRRTPSEAEIQVAVGHAEFRSHRRRAGLKAYARGLALDSRTVDPLLVENLTHCYGQSEQATAQALILRHKLTGARASLDRLTKSKRSSVRWAAMETLQKLGFVSGAEYQTAAIMDLENPECDVRRDAAHRLGEMGDRRALAPLRAARKKEKENTPWYRSYCLGKESEEAEKKILSRR